MKVVVIHDSTDDENSHATFLNAYLEAHGADPTSRRAVHTLDHSQHNDSCTIWANAIDQHVRLSNQSR